MAAPAALAFHANIPCLAGATSATLRASLTRCSAASMVAPNSRSFETEPMDHDRVSGYESMRRDVALDQPTIGSPFEMERADPGADSQCPLL
jgi:hypothetical protein